MNITSLNSSSQLRKYWQQGGLDLGRYMIKNTKNTDLRCKQLKYKIEITKCKRDLFPRAAPPGGGGKCK